MKDRTLTGEPMQAIFEAAENLTTEIDQAAGCLRAMLLLIDQASPVLPDKGAGLTAVTAATRMFIERARTEAEVIARSSME